MVAGIAIDSWKLAIYKSILDAERFHYTQQKGIDDDTLLLMVHTESVARLQPFVMRAQARAAEYKRDNPEECK